MKTHDVKRVLLAERAARFEVIAHQDSKDKIEHQLE